ncbi:hypothetical protein [Streptomyces sp. GZWMJZ-114]|nr:hypothetical protein [Streptomyces sp. GZWMJZ-114]
MTAHRRLRHSAQCARYRQAYAERYGIRRPTLKICCCTPEEIQ